MRSPECPHCGLSLAEFNKAGRLGCSECYRVFADELHSLLRKIHGSDQHFGKVPVTDPFQLQVRKELLALRRRLKRAIEREEFEKAAGLRDRINQIERLTESDRRTQLR